MAQSRSVVDKVSDWKQAYDAIRDELTPPALRVMSSHLINAVPPQGTTDIAAVQTYVEQVNAAGGVTRLVMANDRTASVVAAMLTQSGVSRVVTETGEDG